MKVGMTGESTLATPLRCPSCGAIIEPGDMPVVSCEYCGGRVFVPAEYRSYTPLYGNEQPTASQYTTARRKATRRTVSSVLLVAFFAALVLFLAFYKNPMTKLDGIFSFPRKTAPGQVIAGAAQTLPAKNGQDPRPEDEAPTPAPLASLVLAFGDPGTAPGQLNDARYLALDAQGKIFTADFEDGRVQVFDSQGKFLHLIQMPSEADGGQIFINGLAAGEDASLYVLRAGEILKFSADNGQLLQTIPDRFPEFRYNSLASAGKSRLVATNGMAGADDILLLDAQGELLSHWEDVIQSVQADDPALDLDLAIDRSGNFYLLSGLGAQVYVYGPEGKFRYRFGGQGDGPGQFDSFPNAIAVDARGRIYILDGFRLLLYDSNGNYLNGFNIDYETAGGAPRDLAIGPDEAIYTLTYGGKVLKYTLNIP